MAKSLRHLVGLLISWLSVAGATTPSSGLSDPTRPATLSATPEAQSADSEGQVKPFELQSILLRPGQKPKALIGGQWVEQGQVYSGSRLIRVTDASVILQQQESSQGKSRYVLRLNPDAEKKKPAPIQPKRAVKME
jgi:hypothetical protein